MWASNEDDDEEDDYEYDDEDEEDDYQEDKEYELSTTNFSASLKKALGLDVDEELETDWTPPSYSGLANSNRIIGEDVGSSIKKYPTFGDKEIADDKRSSPQNLQSQSYSQSGDSRILSLEVNRVPSMESKYKYSTNSVVGSSSSSMALPNRQMGTSSVSMNEYNNLSSSIPINPAQSINGRSLNQFYELKTQNSETRRQSIQLSVIPQNLLQPDVQVVKELFQGMTLDMFLRRVNPGIIDTLRDDVKSRQQESARLVFRSIKSYIERLNATRIFRERSVFSSFHKALTSVQENKILNDPDMLIDYLNCLLRFFDLINAGDLFCDIAGFPILYEALQRLLSFCDSRDIKFTGFNSSNLYQDLSLPEFLSAASSITGAISSILDAEVQAEAAKGAVTAIQSYLGNKEESFAKESAVGKLQQVVDYTEDELDPLLTEENTITYIDFLHDYLEQMLLDDDNDDNDFENISQDNMSSNLLQLFGRKGVQAAERPMDWNAPKTYGLDNSTVLAYYDPNDLPWERRKNNCTSTSFPDSKPITSYSSQNKNSGGIGEQGYDGRGPRSEPTNTMFQAQSKFDEGYGRQSQVSEAKESKSTSSAQFGFPPNSSYSNSTSANGGGGGGSEGNRVGVSAQTSVTFGDAKDQGDEGDYYDEEDDDDDDDEYGYGYDDDVREEGDDDYEEGGLGSLNMSANLRRALGMEVEDDDFVTDWKPPAFTGLSNSSRLIDEDRVNRAFKNDYDSNED